MLRTLSIFRHQQRGVSAVEVVLGVSLLAVIVLFSTDAVVRFVSQGAVQVDRVRALYLAEEALEVARFLHDEDWGDIQALTNGTQYYIDWNQSPVELTATPLLVDGKFAQTLTFSAVERNIVSDIVPAGTGTVDPDTRLVTATVSWEGRDVTLQTYLADITNI